MFKYLGMAIRIYKNYDRVLKVLDEAESVKSDPSPEHIGVAYTDVIELIKTIKG